LKNPLFTTLPTLAILLLGAAPARAHEFWLAPSTYRAARGDSVLMKVFVGTGFRGEVKPYASTRVVAWAARAEKMDDLRETSVNGDEVFGRWRAEDGGGAVVAYESNFVTISLPAAEFDSYLELEGLDGPLAARAAAGARAGEGRERYERCPKTWIAGTDLKRITQPVGQSIELVPLGDPSAPGALSVKLLFRGEPLAGALVRAWNQPLAHGASPTDGAARDSVGPLAHARTNAKGVATLPLPKSGEWMVSAVHMVPSSDPRSADWESYWASLTFARMPRTERRR
jgi:uncharacterized GH25 family protein